MMRFKLMLILLLVHTTLTRGQITCGTCASETEYTPCDTSDALPCSNFGEGYICISDAPREQLCIAPPPTCTQEGKFHFPGAGDCDRYYECDSSLVLTNKFCTNGQLFSELQQDCVAADKSECNFISSTINSEVTSKESPSTSTNLPSESTEQSSTLSSEITTENQLKSGSTDISIETTTFNVISSTVNSDITTVQSELTDISNVNEEISSSPTSVITTTEGELTSDHSDSTGGGSTLNPTETTLTTNIITSTEGSSPGNRDSSEEATSESNEITTDDVASTSEPTSSTENTSTQSSTTETTIRCSRFSRFPDPSDCHKYFSCIWRPFFGYTKVSRTCPFNLVYDEDRSSCRFNAKCGDRPKYN